MERDPSKSEMSKCCVQLIGDRRSKFCTGDGGGTTIASASGEGPDSVNGSVHGNKVEAVLIGLGAQVGDAHGAHA